MYFYITYTVFRVLKLIKDKSFFSVLKISIPFPKNLPIREYLSIDFQV